MVSGNKRNGTVDVLRYVAAAGIVLFHSHAPLAEVGYAALPLFAIFVSAFAIVSRRATPEPQLRRLLVVWLLWSGIYGGLKIADALVAGRPLASEFELWMLQTGTALHLWFLPFAIFLVAAGFLIRNLGRWPLALGVTALSLLAFWAGNRLTLPVPFQSWAFVAPAALYGFLLGRAQGAQDRLQALGIVALTGALAFLAGWNLGLWHYLGAVLVASLAFAINTPPGRLSGWLRDVSLGVYLVHPAVIAVALRLPGPSGGTNGFAALVILASTAVALVFLLFRPLRPLLALPAARQGQGT